MRNINKKERTPIKKANNILSIPSPFLADAFIMNLCLPSVKLPTPEVKKFHFWLDQFSGEESGHHVDKTAIKSPVLVTQAKMDGKAKRLNIRGKLGVPERIRTSAIGSGARNAWKKSLEPARGIEPPTC
jgi:hypothetical protein